MKIHKNQLIDYSLVLLLIVISGIHIPYPTMFYIFTFVYSFYIFIIRKKKTDKLFLIIMSLFIFIFSIQTFIFSFVSMITIFGFFIRVLIAYFVIKAVDYRFMKIYIKLMFYLAFVSLLFYVVTGLSTSIADFLTSNFAIYKWGYGYMELKSKTSILGLYTYAPDDKWYRNIGPYGEAGMFAGHLLLAYMLNFFSDNNDKKRNGIILLIAIFTTLSTTVLLAVSVFLFFVYYQNIKNSLLRVLIVLCFVIGGPYAYFNLDFIGPKIESQISRAMEVDPFLEDTNTQRFLNILRDVEDFKGHEVFGRGLNPYTRYSYDPENQIRTVGLTDILVKFGTPLFILIMYFIYHSIRLYLLSQKKYNFFNCFGIFFSILVLLMSEPYFNYPLFWSLLFLQFIYKVRKRPIS